MQSKRWMPNATAVSLAQLILCVMAIALPFVQWSADSPAQWHSDLQQLAEQKTRLQQALIALKEHRTITRTVSNNTDTVDSITLSIIEALKQQAQIERVELTQLTVTQSENQQGESEEKGMSVHALRVNFAFNTPMAMDLLPLLDVLKEAAQWRPVEIRGCSFVRLTEVPVSLHAACAADVYYFPEVDL